MTLKTTIRSTKRSKKGGESQHPPGLLQFAPMGPGRSMRYIALTGTEVTIGRSETCDIHVEDSEASRLHARVSRSKRYWELIDNDSTNGVYLNGKRITEYPLAGGEVIRIGSTFYRFFVQGIASRSQVFRIKSGPIVAGPAFDEFWEVLDRAALSKLSVLVHGETGTGKELIASYMHENGGRASEPFVPVNCAAIPHDLFESELFGHGKGAFTGATSDKLGLIRKASGGTLFLDEVGELPQDCQAKLLRFLQDRQVWPVGATASHEVDIRLVCATNRDLEQLSADGVFRSDLYARLADLELRLPALRKRLEDVPLLVEHFLRKHGDGEEFEIGAKAIEHLCIQRWPYNIRELESTIRRAILFAGEARNLEVEHLVGKVARPRFTPMETVVPVRQQGQGGEGGASAVDPTKETWPADAWVSAKDAEAVEDPRAMRLKAALVRHEGNANEAAAELGISRSQLYRRAKKFGIDVAHYRR